MKAQGFNVFLCHNSEDKPRVRELGVALKERGLSVWLDEWELVPGRLWQAALEEVIETVPSAVVLVGKDGLGPWEQAEMRACLNEFVQRKLPVIPVLLPGSPQKPTLPLFLRAFTWVDLRQGLSKEGIDRLEWGIRGEKGTTTSPTLNSEAQTTGQQELRVLTVGSCKTPRVSAEFKSFCQACKSIGKALVMSRHTIVAGSSNPTSADYQILAGASASGVLGRVILLRPTLRDEDDALEAVLTNLSVDRQLGAGKWRDVREQQVLTSDIVLAIGGGVGTSEVIDICRRADKPILPLGLFSGSVHDRWSEFAPAFQRQGVSDEMQSRLKKTLDVSLVMMLIQRISR